MNEEALNSFDGEAKHCIRCVLTVMTVTIAMSRL
jgi:hypothetical protein